MYLHYFSKKGGAAVFALGVLVSVSAQAQEALFEYVGPPDAVNLPEHAVAGQNVRINQRAFQSSSIVVELFGETYTADRDSTDTSRPGQTVWVGHLQGDPGDSVILTRRGNVFSGMIQLDAETYRIGGSSAAGSRLYMLDMRMLPPDDVGGVPDAPASSTQTAQAETAHENTVQDLLVVYNQAGCDSAQGSAGSDCSQLEADIVTAVADINAAYSSSGIDISMNLVGTHKTNYTGTGASATLTALRSTTDGQMDEVHGVRDALGADLVAMVYDGEGCGIGYRPASPSYAFSVTDEPCLVGNRTMAHEIGHNQGAHHDRVTVGTSAASGDYHFGYRRCTSGADNHGSPYFRTILAYPCGSVARVGRFSNPNVNYSGVPQGVDPDIDPDNGAYNARTLNESASYVAGFRTGTPATPPDAPSGIGATATGSDSIDVDWLDNSGNETSFTLQRSPDNATWSTVATLGANVTSHADTGLDPETLYYYQVRASNSAGDSAWNGPASDTTHALPPSVDDVAYGEVAGSGSVSGSYSATQASGGAVQSITETHSGGPKHSRRQSYDHDWLFDVFGGAGGVIASVDAWVSGSEGADFYYSTDGGSTLNLMFTVNNTSQGSPQTFVLPGGTSGQVRIIVQDASQSNGEAVDTVFIDHLVITSHTQAGDPPAAPSNMSVSGTTSSSVSVLFDDNAEDEFGFELWRATSDPAGDCAAGSVADTLCANAGTGAVSHTDNSAAPDTTYWYWAVSFNGAGNNGSCSNAASGTTGAAPAISLSVNGYKDRGVKFVDLNWSGAATPNVDIWRDGALLTTTANDTAHTDNTGQKGGGSFTYQVCEQGSTTSCSPEQTAVF